MDAKELRKIQIQNQALTDQRWALADEILEDLQRLALSGECETESDADQIKFALGLVVAECYMRRVNE